MSTDFTNIKHVAQTTIDLVNGYMKEKEESLLPTNIAYYNISPLINKIIILYYGYEREHKRKAKKMSAAARIYVITHRRKESLEDKLLLGPQR